MVPRRKGFTLIELLVVIAIIAILAALLFPIFNRAKASAKLSTCMNNLKQMGSAMSMYLDSYEDHFPWAGAALGYAHDARRAPLGIGGQKTCYDALKPFIKNDAIRWCPEWPKAWRTAGDWSYWYFCPHMGTDPQGNYYVKTYNQGKAALCGHTLGQIRYATKKPVICEVSSQHLRFGGTGTNYLYPILYADGHVRSVVISSDSDAKLPQYLYIGIDGTYDGVYK